MATLGVRAALLCAFISAAAPEARAQRPVPRISELYAPQLLVLEIADDGRGIAPGAAEAAASDGHLGIAGMRARAGRAGGTLDIASHVGAGTTVRVTLPVTA